MDTLPPTHETVQLEVARLKRTVSDEHSPTKRRKSNARKEGVAATERSRHKRLVGNKPGSDPNKFPTKEVRPTPLRVSALSRRPAMRRQHSSVYMSNLVLYGRASQDSPVSQRHPLLALPPFPQRRKARREMAIPPLSLAFLVNLSY